MKALNRLLKSILLTVLIYCCNTIIIIGQSNEARWSYPVRPGMSEWAILKTDTEKFNACQIPENIIDTISTADLLGLCIDFPLFHRIILYDNMLHGMDALTEKFNGFAELSKRNNLDKTLIERYRRLQIPKDFDSISDTEIKRIVAEAWRLEIILVRFGLSDSCSPEYIKDYVAESHEKYVTKRNNPHIFSSFSYVLPFHILAKTLSKLSPEVGDQLNCNTMEYRNLIEHLVMPTGEYESSVLNLADSVLQDSIR
ncbi:MAG: hypothetical protein JRJ57_08480 [Deltaproteobacteria bacterium]|nr:hypothetical protein [Deltaproteobacteria bacterium]